MKATRGSGRRKDEAELRRALEFRIERAEAEAEVCRSQLIAMSLRHPSLRWLKA